MWPRGRLSNPRSGLTRFFVAVVLRGSFAKSIAPRRRLPCARLLGIECAVKRLYSTKGTKQNRRHNSNEKMLGAAVKRTLLPHTVCHRGRLSKTSLPIPSFFVTAVLRGSFAKSKATRHRLPYARLLGIEYAVKRFYSTKDEAK